MTMWTYLICPKFRKRLEDNTRGSMYCFRTYVGYLKFRVKHLEIDSLICWGRHVLVGHGILQESLALMLSVAFTK